MKILKIALFGLFNLCMLVTLEAQDTKDSANLKNSHESNSRDSNQSNSNPIATTTITQNPQTSTPKLPNPKRPNPSNVFQNQGLTFYFGSGTPAAQRVISTALEEQVRYDFPNKAPNIINAPTFIGYQYHVKNRLSVGLVYCVSGVRTPNLIYPDLQNPSESTEFNYQININSFMGSVDYHWYYRTGKKSSLSLHSGLALGVYDVNFTTQIIGGNGQNLPEYNLSTGGNGWQITLIGVKQSFNYKLLKNFGYVANLGVGMNVIGLSAGATYTL